MVRKNNRPTRIRLLTRRLPRRVRYMLSFRIFVTASVSCRYRLWSPHICPPFLTPGLPRPACRPAGMCYNTTGRRARVPPPLESVAGLSNRVVSSIFFFYSGINPISSSSCHVCNYLFPMAASVGRLVSTIFRRRRFVFGTTLTAAAVASAVVYPVSL